jgi:hypothetical protein
MTDSEMPPPTTFVLKRDARGRVRSTPAQRRALLDQFSRSGLSGPAFARVAGVNYQTFASWRHQQRSGVAALALGKTPSCVAAPSPPPVRFVEAKLPAAQAGVLLRITLPGGAALQIADASQAMLAAQLIKALA